MGTKINIFSYFSKQTSCGLSPINYGNIETRLEHLPGAVSCGFKPSSDYWLDTLTLHPAANEYPLGKVKSRTGLCHSYDVANAMEGSYSQCLSGHKAIRHLWPLKCQENLHLKMSSVYVVCWIFLQTFQTYFCILANSVDPDQTDTRGAVWSGSTLFAKMTFKITSRWQ